MRKLRDKIIRRYKFKMIFPGKILFLSALLLSQNLGCGDYAPQSTQAGSTYGYFFARPSTETTRVDIKHNTITLKIPRNFIISLGPPPQVEGTPYVEGMLTFPDMSGATDENLQCFSNAQMGRCNVVNFVYQGKSLEFGDFQADLRGFLSSIADSSEQVYGLQTARRPDAYAFADEQKQQMILISCSSVTTVCQMVVDSHGTSWRLRFDQRILPDWRKIAFPFIELAKTFLLAT